MRRAVVWGLLAVLVCALPARAQSSGTSTDAVVADLKAFIRDYYVAYSIQDKVRYRSFVTDDYLLLENGEVLDFNGDVAGMPAPELHTKRKDAFAFRSVSVTGDSAVLVYELTSDITDDKGARHRRYLESAVLRRLPSGWRLAVLHSTRIDK